MDVIGDALVQLMGRYKTVSTQKEMAHEWVRLMVNMLT